MWWFVVFFIFVDVFLKDFWQGSGILFLCTVFEDFYRDCQCSLTNLTYFIEFLYFRYICIYIYIYMNTCSTDI